MNLLGSRTGSILRVENGEDKLAPGSWNGTAYHGCFLIRNPQSQQSNCSQVEHIVQNSTIHNNATTSSWHYRNETL